MKKIFLIVSLLLPISAFGEYKITLGNMGGIKLPDGSVAELSCKELLENDPSLSNGVYTISLGNNIEKNVYCDMTGGGWTLIDNFTNGEAAPDNYGAAYGLSKIYNVSLLESAGYAMNLTDYNVASTYNEPNLFHFYYSNDPVGYIEKALPNFGTEVKVTLGNWYPVGSSSIYINNVERLRIAANSGLKTYVGNFNHGDVLRITENNTSIVWVDNIWVR